MLSASFRAEVIEAVIAGKPAPATDRAVRQGACGKPVPGGADGVAGPETGAGQPAGGRLSRAGERG